MGSEKRQGFKAREDKWMKIWLENRIFCPRRDPNKKKYFITFPYPYMNGSLHLGHAFSSGRLDVLARYMRMKGFNVLYPWAWHWTGEAVMGIVHRLEAGDVDVKNRLIKLDGVDESEIDNFLDPLYLVKYFTKVGKEDIIRYGNSIDWSREFHTTKYHKLYNKFIEWQIRKLKEKGFIIQSPYPVVWCPRDKSPTGDHDRMKGVGVRPELFYLIKFKLLNTDIYLVAGTLRPETIFGATNLWIKPDTDYCIIEVNGAEKWIVSKESVEKLENQLMKIKVLDIFDGSKLIGNEVVSPLTGRLLPILPAKFIDPNKVTGIVYSVPAHAPFDYLALRDLKESIKPSNPIYDVVMKIEPISIISVDGYGEWPAKDIVEKMNIKEQTEFAIAEEATKQIYTDEFHKGIMKDNCLQFSGKKVSEARMLVIEELKSRGTLEEMYDLPEEVVCRCGTRTIVKIIKDQWLLKYSSREWKELAKKAVSKMSFYPSEVRNMFLYYIDWYEDWPCTRKTGLGTPFPYDRSWIVETLTDSTIYMAFYIISKYYNEGLLEAEKIGDWFFDYVFLGIGDPKNLSKRYGVDPDLLREIRDDFLYWYPVDLRGSGKDLIGNHLTFYIFHHVAIFPENLWPRSISVNGFTLLNGKEMSKTKGNYISLREAMARYGADAVRVGILTLSDGLDDPDIRLDEFKRIRDKIEEIPNFIKRLMESSTNKNKLEFFDKLILTKISELIIRIENLLNEHRIAGAGKLIVYTIPNIIKEYVSMVDYPNKLTLEIVIEAWIKMLSLYAPYIAEEVWHEVLKKNTFIALENWPSIPEQYTDKNTIYIDRYSRDLLEDLKNIVRIVAKDKTGINIKLIVCAGWKWSILKELVDKERITIKDIINLAERFKVDPKEAADFGKYVLREWHKRYAKYREILKILDNNKEYEELSTIFIHYVKNLYPQASIEVVKEEFVSKDIDKSRRALPLIPSILLIK